MKAVEQQKQQSRALKEKSEHEKRTSKSPEAATQNTRGEKGTVQK